MVTEETMSRLKLPHGKTGAPPLKENMKIRGARIHKKLVGSSTGGTLLLEFNKLLF
jgi:hypothetical protein